MAGLAPEDPDVCPTDTHYCYQRQGDVRTSCCPRQSTLVGDQCMPLVPLVARCRANEQCAGSNSDCINGKRLRSQSFQYLVTSNTARLLAEYRTSTSTC